MKRGGLLAESEVRVNEMQVSVDTRFRLWQRQTTLLFLACPIVMVLASGDKCVAARLKREGGSVWLMSC